MNKSYNPFLTVFAIFTTIVLIFGLLLIPPRAFSYGVLAPAQTHQHILREAYRLLAADPAFDPALFPKLDEILAQEGVNWANINYNGSGLGVIPDVSLLEGPGPDCKGNSPFSWHYYNPVIKEGNGPMATGKYFHYLSEGMLTNKRAAVPQAAAWSAHFLADMHCPVHTVGMMKASAEKLRQEHLAKYKGTKSEGAIYLTDDIKGSVQLGYLTPVKFLSNNFQTEISRFFDKGEDWFDPWYYNGTTPFVTETSSHIAWETTVNPGPYNLSGYEPTWKNGHPSFDHPIDVQVIQASQLAVAAATLTRSKLEYFFDNPQPIINHAIRDVYTMWRGSFSALTPKIVTQEKENEIHVSANIRNRAGAAMETVQAKLTVSACAIKEGVAIQTVGRINAGGNLTGGDWVLKPGIGTCKLKLQIIAACAAPDLQYAETEAAVSLKAKPVEPIKSPPAPTDKSSVENPDAPVWVLYDANSGGLHNDGPDFVTINFGDDGFVAIGTKDNYNKGWRYQAKWDLPPTQLTPGSMITLTATVTNGRLDWPGGTLIWKDRDVPAHGTITVTVPKVPTDGKDYGFTYNPNFLVGPGRHAWSYTTFMYKYVKPGDSIPKVPPFRPTIDKK